MTKTIKTLIVALPLAMAISAGAFAKTTSPAVAFDKLPKAVQATITKEAGDLKVSEVDKIKKDKKTVYEAKIAQADGSTKTIDVDAKGKLLEAAAPAAAAPEAAPSDSGSK